MRNIVILLRFTSFSSILFFLILGQPSFVFPAQERTPPTFYEFPLPESLRICGEPIPLDNVRVREMLDREFTIIVWDRAQVYMWLKRAARYFPYIEREIAKAGMPEDIKYLAVAESSLITHIQSKKGAIGIWQFMARTARHNGLRKDRSIDERRSLERSTKAALKYLKYLKSTFGTWTLALAAYNAGEAKLKKEIKRQKVKDYFKLNLPRETERFIFRIAAIKIILEKPERYGYHIARERVYKPIKCDTVKIRNRIPFHITDVAHALGTDFKTLKELNPHILAYYLPTGRYTIKVPPGLGSRVPTALKKLSGKTRYRMRDASGGYYIVQPGDTLTHIAKRTGVPVATLKKLNGISGSLIKVGQKIRIKP